MATCCCAAMPSTARTISTTTRGVARLSQSWPRRALRSCCASQARRTRSWCTGTTPTSGAPSARFLRTTREGGGHGVSESGNLIRDVSVIDGLGGEPVRNAAVLVEGDRISWVGPAIHAPSVGEGRVVEAGGHSLLPGMINCHAHLCNDGAADLFAQVVSDTVPIATIRAVL